MGRPQVDSTTGTDDVAPRLTIHSAVDVVRRLYPARRRIGVRVHRGSCQVGTWKGDTFSVLAEGASWDEAVGVLLAK